MQHPGCNNKKNLTDVYNLMKLRYMRLYQDWFDVFMVELYTLLYGS